MKRLTRKSLILSFVLCFILFGTSALGAIHSFGVIGDAGHINDWVNRVRGAMSEARILRLILPGDNLYNPSYSYEKVWNPWSQMGFTFDVVAIGNHGLSYEKEIRFFKIPGEFYSRNFVRARSPYRFIVLNSDNEATAVQQARWFEQQLQSANEPLLFVVFHHPPVTLSKRHPWEEREEFHIQIRPLIQKYRHRIRALFVGHEHFASFVTLGTLPMIVSGAVGEHLPTPGVNYSEFGMRVQTQWMMERDPHWGQLDIDTTKGDVFFHFRNAVTNGYSCSARILAEGMALHPNCRQRRRY